MNNVHIYRFHGAVAVSLPGKGETVYLHPEDAAAIADAMREAVADIASSSFTLSQFRSREFPLKDWRIKR